MTTTADRVVEVLVRHGADLVIGVPCSHLHGLQVACERDRRLRYVAATNEGEAVAVAVGWQLAGGVPVVLMQNSGLGNAVNPISSLLRTFDVPVLLVVSWRGEPGTPDEPQHALMGRITPGLLADLEVGVTLLPDDADEAVARVDHACREVAGGRPHAVLVRKGQFSRPAERDPVQRADALPSRADVLRAVAHHAGPEDLLIATTGFTSRELEALCDRPGNLYVVGSMGCAASVALGAGLRAGPSRRVLVLDGDGAALMRLEALAGIGAQRPPGLVHMILDNGTYESTGGQATPVGAVDFPAVARACGYPQASSVSTPTELAAALASTGPGPRLLHVPIREGAPAGLGRPALSPPEVARRFAAHVRAVPGAVGGA